MSAVTRPTVALLWSTPHPARVVAVAARLTYSKKPVEQLAEGITAEEAQRSVEAVLERRHWSVLRHVVFCFLVSGISRAMSHQLVRHTVGHSYEQRSQQYREETDPSFIVPDSVTNAEGNIRGLYEAAVKAGETTYHLLRMAGVPREDARQVLPNATETQLIWTANAEAVLNFVRARACRVNVPEARYLASRVRGIVALQFPQLLPFLGPTCWTEGVCYEGPKFSKECNNPWRSPTVLWTRDFPRKITLVSAGGAVKEVSGEGED